MDIITIVLWVVTLAWFFFSLKKDKKKTISSVKSSGGMMKGMAGQIVAILFLIGMILTFIPPDTISKFIGESSLLVSSVVSAAVGSITLIPAFVAFPLVGSLIDSGANIVPMVAFLTTLTMVGVVTIPLERKEFGTKFTVARNVLSFGFAIIISMVMGVLM